jgi:peptide/nickel transport system ATP-binding protein
MSEGGPMLEITNLRQEYHSSHTALFGARHTTTALDGVTLSVRPGERFGLVGESGSGKSTILRAIAGLIEPTAGSIRFDGQEFVGRRTKDLRRARQHIQMIFQDPIGSLDPRMRIGDVIAEPIVAQGRRPATGQIEELLRSVGLPVAAAARYPHQFSGGQRQRIAIARALSTKPRLLLADEPVSALDVSVRAQILNLINDLLERFSMTLLFVSHDLGVVNFMCNRVAVMQDGCVVESGDTAKVLKSPQSPYTRRLMASAPTLKRSLAS